MVSNISLKRTFLANSSSDYNKDVHMGEYLDFLDPERERELEEDLDLELEPV